VALALATALAWQMPGWQTPAWAQAPEPPADLMLRVGLETDLARFNLPCCDTRWRVELASGPLTLGATAFVEPAAGTSGQAVYRLQVAALKDERQAQDFARSVQTKSGLPSDVVFDAGSDLYRVRAGRFPTREAGDAARPRLQPLGLSQSWMVGEGGALEHAAMVVTIDGKSYRHEGRWLEIAAPRDVGLPHDGTRYRGSLMVFLNERGRLNVINELPLEDYLRGVVPREMGPYVFDQLEALKAQTVAARTYTVRNLGEFNAEGYDICSTPRCQVYGGMNVEHPLSDRAVAETAGLIAAYEGKPIDALYSATSGGHTEDVGYIFPLKKDEVYLKGVPCLEGGSVRLEGDRARGRPFPAGLVELIVPAGDLSAPALARQLQHLAKLAKLTPPEDGLRSLERAEVGRYLRSLFDLVLEPRLVHTSAAELAEPPADWPERERRFALMLAAQRLTVPEGGTAGSDPLDADGAASMLFEISRYLGVLQEQLAFFLEAKAGKLKVRVGGEHLTVALPTEIATFQRRGPRVAEGALDLMAGDPLVLYWHEGRIQALVQSREAKPVRLDRQASRRVWSTFKSDGELKRSVQARYPGFPFNGFQVMTRGASGRVAKMRLLGDGDREQMVEGLAVRWTFDLWDNQFTAERTVQNGHGGWLFRGRGWGHGVGMSQAGAYGMAVRGASFREILEHYYTGIAIGRMVVRIPAPAATPVSP
jgi:stage II sporulation protein D